MRFRRLRKIWSSSVHVLEHERRVCAAKAERVRERRPQSYVVAARANDRHIREGGVKLIDMRAFADEAVLHHQQ